MKEIDMKQALTHSLVSLMVLAGTSGFYLGSQAVTILINDFLNSCSTEAIVRFGIDEPENWGWEIHLKPSHLQYSEAVQIGQLL